jgi:hypothetical protein
MNSAVSGLRPVSGAIRKSMRAFRPGQAAAGKGLGAASAGPEGAENDFGRLMRRPGTSNSRGGACLTGIYTGGKVLGEVWFRRSGIFNNFGSLFLFFL